MFSFFKKWSLHPLWNAHDSRCSKPLMRNTKWISHLSCLFNIWKIVIGHQEFLLIFPPISKPFIHSFPSQWTISFNKFLSFFLSFFFLFFWATPVAHGGSQARDLIRATAADLYHSHSNAGSQPCLRPAPQLTAMPDP